jgi:hypothetical protein
LSKSCRRGIQGRRSSEWQGGEARDVGSCCSVHENCLAGVHSEAQHQRDQGDLRKKVTTDTLQLCSRHVTHVCSLNTQPQSASVATKERLLTPEPAFASLLVAMTHACALCLKLQWSRVRRLSRAHRPGAQATPPPHRLKKHGARRRAAPTGSRRGVRQLHQENKERCSG